jgi:DNA-binding transcriptional LysR family regulator
MLNLHHLRIFHAVAEHGSYTRAAEALVISQPAVSRQVRDLERALDLCLIDQIGRRIYLTDAGRVLHEYSTRLFGIAADVEAAMHELRVLTQGRLALGASTTIGMYALPATLAKYRANFPGIELQVEIDNTARIAEGVRRYRLELGLVEGDVSDPLLLSTPWRSDELVVILPPRHPLAAAPTLAPSSLQDAAFVMREQGSGTRSVAERYLSSAGIHVRTVLELSSTEAIKRAVASGLGLAVVSRLAIGTELAAGALVARSLGDLAMTRRLSLVTLAGRRLTRAANAFIACTGKEGEQRHDVVRPDP